MGRDPVYRWGMMLSVLLCVLLVTAGCGERKKQGADGPKPRAAAPVQQFDPEARAAQLKPKQSVSYVGAQMRDPFESIVVARKAEEDVRQKVGRAPSPLQRYDVQSFKLIGIIEKSDGNVAMLIAPDGKGHMVEEGMPLGMNEGRISRILADVVEVEEVRRNYRGERERKIIPLVLPKPKEAETETWDYSGNEGQ